VSEDLPADDLVRTRDREAIAGMFNRIAGSYDRMNRIMTLGQDHRWRRLAADQAMLRPGERALDVAAGTGDMARELANRVAPNGRVVGIDIATDMLAVAKAKSSGLPITYQSGDVADLDYTAEFDAITVAFGFRNFADREPATRAMFQSLKPRGRLVILELVPSHGRLKPVVDFYEQTMIPLLGRLVSRDRDAYRYLPRSVAASTTTAEIQTIMQRVGLIGVRARELNFGTVAIVRGVKPA